VKVVIVSKALVSSIYRKKLSELAKLGVEITAIVPREWREAGTIQRFEEGEDTGFELIITPLLLNGHFHLHAYPHLLRMFREARADLVHLDEEPFNVATYLGVRAARRTGLPSLFFTWQNMPRKYPPPFSLMERSVFRGCGAAIAGNQEAAAGLKAKGYEGAVFVVPQFGVDTQLFRPRPRSPGPFTVGFLNRLIPAKGPILALEALQMLPQNVRLAFVGDGPLRAAVEGEIESRDLLHRVDLKSRVLSREVPDLVSTFDVVVLPSLTTPRWKEQFGRVLIEAMASGVPVVGSDSGEIPHVIGDAGIVVPEGDAGALARAIERIYADADLRSDLSTRGRERAKNCYSNERIASDTAAAYRTLLTLT
jgi:glycosyltransferase involved in cell wall biosynthesis